MKTFTCSKTTLFLVLAAAFLFFCYPTIGNAQNAPTVFAIVDFMKVKPENDAKYLDVEKNSWKPLHQERLNQGKITGWILYRVLYSGTDDPYNYVTMTLFDNPVNLENPWADIDPAKVLPGKDLDKLLEETYKSRDLVKSNLIVRLDEVVPEGGPGEIKYIEVDFMKVKPGSESAYVEVEENIWKPVHKEFINAGTRVGWSLWDEIYPAGSAMDYQYVTANYFKDFSKIGMADYNAAFEKAHAGKNIEELNQKTDDSRDLMRSELWQLVEVVMNE